MRHSMLLLTLSTIIAGTVQAEPLVLQNKDNNLSLSIYNQNLALVKDNRNADLKSGMNEVVFDGVAQRIQSETAIVYGTDIKVLEQNYSYDLMTNNNIIDQSVGEEVVTVRENPQTGENIYEKATIIGSIYGQPILRFPYGIEANFPGRIVFQKIPANISNKPILTAKINAKNAGMKNLHLAYLTEGLSWKTDYVANVADKNKLDLTGWVTINNESGIDYNNAKIQVIAGDVKVARNAPMVRTKMMMAVASFDGAMAESAAGGVTPEAINSYELYTLPNITTIKDKQTKQIGLIEKNGVTFEKEFELASPLYLGSYNSDKFEKLHPSITYVIENTQKSNLGISLPAGTVRFYANDKNGNLQFIGSSHIGNTAKEDTLRLSLGEAFNITANGKITEVKSEEIKRTPTNSKCFNIKTLKTYDVEININNADVEDNKVIISQNITEETKIIKESEKGKNKNAYLRQWELMIPKESKKTLTFSAEFPVHNHRCD